MMETIKNIIFDFGGVIVNLNKQAAIDAFNEIGFKAEEYIGEYVQTGIFSGLELGTMTEEDFDRFVCRQAGHEVGADTIRNAWNRMLTDIPLRRMKAIKRLRERYHIYMLSNTNRIHWDYSCRHLFPQEEWRPEDCFERIFLSFEMHLMKPDPEVFRHVLDATRVQPEETLFVDDSATNCTVAQDAGLRVFHSRRPDDWLEIIK